MGKVLEGHTMQLMQKWDIGTPRFVIANSLEEFDSLVRENEKSIVIIDQSNFPGSGLCEEIMAGPGSCEANIYMLPVNIEFTGPPPDLVGILFQQQKKMAFKKVLFGSPA